MANPSHPLWVASVSDPAIALTAPGTPEREAVQAYVKSRTLADLARVLGLVATGSSDYHGTGKLNRIGERTTSPAALEVIEALGTGTPVITP